MLSRVVTFVFRSVVPFSASFFAPSSAVPLALSCALVCVWPSTGHAQDLFEPAARQGYYLSAGLKSGLGTLRDTTLGFMGAMPELGLTLRAGQVVDDALGFGLILTALASRNATWTTGLGALSLEGQYVPVPREDFALRASIGIVGLGVNRVEQAEEKEDDPGGDLGTLFTLGASYDWFAFRTARDQDSGGFAFTVVAETFALSAGGLFGFGGTVGIEVTHWFGFDKSRLDQSLDQAFKPAFKP